MFDATLHIHRGYSESASYRIDTLGGSLGRCLWQVKLSISTTKDKLRALVPTIRRQSSHE